MLTRFILVLPALAVFNLMAQPLERGNITSCAYQAGTAFEIQNIRQVENHDWTQFKANIMQIYSESQGREDLLIIAERVFIQPPETAPDLIHDQIFNACLQRQQGSEPLQISLGNL